MRNAIIPIVCEKPVSLSCNLTYTERGTICGVFEMACYLFTSRPRSTSSFEPVVFRTWLFLFFLPIMGIAANIPDPAAGQKTQQHSAPASGDLKQKVEGGDMFCMTQMLAGDILALGWEKII